MGVKLFDHQLKAINKMTNGCVLCGGVGSGKSLTSLAYYYLENGGDISSVMGEDYVPMNDPPMDLYIITPAKKRDSLEWEKEMTYFLLSTHPEVNLYSNKVVVDSWNNIKKYIAVQNAFFIFDEQRVIGKGAWVKAFLKIAKKNRWILLSATPGDTWEDYIPVFVANGFYKNRTEFIDEHVIYNYRYSFPKIDRYINTRRLTRLRDRILIEMDFERKTVVHQIDIYTEYDGRLYKETAKRRWDPYKDEPIVNAAGLCYIWRKIVNSNEAKQVALLELFEKHPKLIIFYNFDYELDILKNLRYGDDVEVAEWNGHKHQPIPDGDSWVYLVQYNAGSEGWNCVRTDTIVFYSQSYSYRTMEQARGRIDRLNTPFVDLYYYNLKTKAPIDLAIERALTAKKNFNATKFINRIKW